MKKKPSKGQNFSFATSTWKIIQKEKYQPIFYWHKNFQVQFNNGAKLLKFIWKKIWSNRKTKQFNNSSNVLKVHLIHENAANKWKEFFQKYYQLTWNTCIRLGNFLFFIFFILYKDYRKIHEVDIKKPKEYSRILTNSHTSNDTW